MRPYIFTAKVERLYFEHLKKWTVFLIILDKCLRLQMSGEDQGTHILVLIDAL